MKLRIYGGLLLLLSFGLGFNAKPLTNKAPLGSGLPFENGLIAYYPLFNSVKSIAGEDTNLVYHRNQVYRDLGIYLSGQPDDYLEFGDWYAKSSENKKQTVSFWVIPALQDRLQPIIWDGHLERARSPRQSVWVNIARGFVHHSLYFSVHYNGAINPGTTAPTFVTATVDYEAGQSQIFFDGQLIASESFELGRYEKANHFYVGKGLEPDSQFEGTLGGLGIWNRALSVEEANELYLHQVTGLTNLKSRKQIMMGSFYLASLIGAYLGILMLLGKRPWEIKWQLE